MAINERIQVMKTKRKTPKKERAAHLGQQAAPKYYLQGKSYRKPKPLSSLKLQIGELLLFGDKDRGELWSLLEVLLRQYWGDKA